MWLTFVLIASVIGANPDVGDWLFGPNNHYYLIGRSQYSWIEAKEYCMARNSELLSVYNEEIKTWLLSRFVPNPQHPGVVQVGLYRSFFPQWLWLNGILFDTTEKMNQIKDDHQCGVFRLKDATWESVHCGNIPEEITRFVCERSAEKHESQIKHDSGGLWLRLESILKHLGITSAISTSTTKPSTSAPTMDIEVPEKLAEDIKHAEELLESENSGDELLPVTEPIEASGAELLNQMTESSGVEGSGWEKKEKVDEIEHDFNEDSSHINIENVPIPTNEKKPDCLEENKPKEMLGILKQFLNRAGHTDLQRLADDDSHSLMDRLLRGISEANTREFKALQPAEKLADNEKEMLFEELGTLLVPEKKMREMIFKSTDDIFT